MTRFRNRREAGRSLGALLRTYATVHPVVLALPRGGVPVACEVARALDAPLDVFVVRKRGTPGNEELARREARYREGGESQVIRNRVVILVDDGMATGASMLAAIRALRALGPRSVMAAVPVASREALSRMRDDADDWACVLAPEPFHDVGFWYEEFGQITDDEVRLLLSSAQRARATLHTPA
jgi:putative phosphoribosyl transferase